MAKKKTAKKKTAAKKTSARRAESAPVAMVEPVPLGPESTGHPPPPEPASPDYPPLAEASAQGTAPVYAFPTRARCPRCGSPQTTATSTDGRLQYRRCGSPICRHTFKAIGKPI